MDNIPQCDTKSRILLAFGHSAPPELKYNYLKVPNGWKFDKAITTADKLYNRKETTKATASTATFGLDCSMTDFQMLMSLWFDNMQEGTDQGPNYLRPDDHHVLEMQMKKMYDEEKYIGEIIEDIEIKWLIHRFQNFLRKLMRRNWILFAISPILMMMN